MKSTPLFLIGAGVIALSSCTTSLSDPNGRGHDRDLDLYELTGQSAENGVTEADIAAAGRNANQAGSLPPRNARVLLVQSGSHQPDEELLAAYRPFCQPVIWNGRVASASDNPYGSSPNQTKLAGSHGRRLRLIAAQQGCSHVIVVFGEIQSDSQPLPTSAVSWVPVVGSLIPSERSGTRLLAQAFILETRSARFTTVAAKPQQKTGLTTDDGSSTINSRRAPQLKIPAYQELASRSFR